MDKAKQLQAAAEEWATANWNMHDGKLTPQAIGWIEKQLCREGFIAGAAYRDAALDQAIKERDEARAEITKYKTELHKIAHGIPSEWAFAELKRQYDEALAMCKELAEQLETSLTEGREDRGHEALDRYNEWKGGRVSEVCRQHPKIKMQIGDCPRCGGEGYTQYDLDEMDNPIAWHNDGTCWQCKGTGRGFLECEVCEEEYRMQQEMEYEEEIRKESTK